MIVYTNKTDKKYPQNNILTDAHNDLQNGYRAEAFVAKHLELVGFTILERNYKKSYGEIDIIARKEMLLVFVEVKMRIDAYFDPAELITHAKQRKIMLVAQEYIDKKTNGIMDCRFDVALVEFDNNNPQITYLADAFGAS